MHGPSIEPLISHATVGWALIVLSLAQTLSFSFRLWYVMSASSPRPTPTPSQFADWLLILNVLSPHFLCHLIILMYRISIFLIIVDLISILDWIIKWDLRIKLSVWQMIRLCTTERPCLTVLVVGESFLCDTNLIQKQLLLPLVREDL